MAILLPVAARQSKSRSGPIHIEYQLSHLTSVAYIGREVPKLYHRYPISRRVLLTYNMSIAPRKIGNSFVSAVGYGAMGISRFYGAVLPTEERLKVSRSESSCH